MDTLQEGAQGGRGREEGKEGGEEERKGKSAVLNAREGEVEAVAEVLDLVEVLRLLLACKSAIIVA